MACRGMPDSPVVHVCVLQTVTNIQPTCRTQVYASRQVQLRGAQVCDLGFQVCVAGRRALRLPKNAKINNCLPCSAFAIETEGAKLLFAAKLHWPALVPLRLPSPQALQLPSPQALQLPSPKALQLPSPQALRLPSLQALQLPSFLMALRLPSSLPASQPSCRPATLSACVDHSPKCMEASAQ